MFLRRKLVHRNYQLYALYADIIRRVHVGTSTKCRSQSLLYKMPLAVITSKIPIMSKRQQYYWSVLSFIITIIYAFCSVVAWLIPILPPLLSPLFVLVHSLYTLLVLAPLQVYFHCCHYYYYSNHFRNHCGWYYCHGCCQHPLHTFCTPEAK